jgi:hypothetical protein
MRVIDRDEVVLNGRYLITDPCYVYGDCDWDKFCKLLWANEGDGITLFEIDGKEIPVMSTCYGDGGYPVIDGKLQVGTFGVDAGLFCFIPWDAEDDDRGVVLDIKGKLMYSNGDAFINGNVIVDTSGNSFEGEEYD